MSIYVEYLDRIRTTYQNAGNGFHPPDAARKISDSISGLESPLNGLAAAIARQRARRFATPTEYETAWHDAIGLIDWQCDALRAAVKNASIADRGKILRTIVDQGVAVANAERQQAADAVLVADIEILVGRARHDAIAAEDHQPYGPGLKFSLRELEALKLSIAERSAPKEDGIYVRQVAKIGGQARKN